MLKPRMQTPFPNKKYNIIYADPPWHFKKWSDTNETRKIPYDIMSKEEIKNLHFTNRRYVILGNEEGD